MLIKEKYNKTRDISCEVLHMRLTIFMARFNTSNFWWQCVFWCVFLFLIYASIQYISLFGMCLIVWLNFNFQNTSGQLKMWEVSNGRNNSVKHASCLIRLWQWWRRPLPILSNCILFYRMANCKIFKCICLAYTIWTFRTFWLWVSMVNLSQSIFDSHTS